MSEVDELREKLDSAHRNAIRNAQEYNRVRDENEQLHELCDRLIEYINDDRCEGCICKTTCRNAELDECWQRTDIREMADKLGMAVD